MDLLAHALRLSGLTLDRPHCSSRLSPEDVVQMVPDLINRITVSTLVEHSERNQMTRTVLQPVLFREVITNNKVTFLSNKGGNLYFLSEQGR
jgi:hypothetical protein